MRAQRVPQAEAGRWSSLGLRQAGAGQAEMVVHPWPMPVPANWPALVNAPQTVAELEAVR